MTAPITRSFVGKGQIWLQASGGKLYPIGNVDKAELSAKVDTDKVLDYTKGGGGVAASYSSITEAAVAIDVSDFNAKNLALALLGTATAVASGTVTGEVVSANLGGLTPLVHVGATTHVVKHTTGTPTYVLNTDYTITGAGIIPLTGGAITDGQSLKVDYTYPAQTDIQTLLTSGQEFRLLLDGVNDADSGKAHVVEIYRWKPSPTSGLALIGNKFGRLSMQGEILADATKVTAGTSKYFRITQVD